MKTTHPIPFNLTIRDMMSRNVRIATPSEQREFSAQRKFAGGCVTAYTHYHQEQPARRLGDGSISRGCVVSGHVPITEAGIGDRPACNQFPVSKPTEPLHGCCNETDSLSGGAADEQGKSRDGLNCRKLQQSCAAGINFDDPGDPFLAIAFVMASGSAFALGWMLCDIFSK